MCFISDIIFNVFKCDIRHIWYYIKSSCCFICFLFIVFNVICTFPGLIVLLIKHPLINYVFPWLSRWFYVVIGECGWTYLHLWRECALSELSSLELCAVLFDLCLSGLHFLSIVGFNFLGFLLLLIWIIYFFRLIWWYPRNWLLTTSDWLDVRVFIEIIFRQLLAVWEITCNASYFMWLDVIEIYWIFILAGTHIPW